MHAGGVRRSPAVKGDCGSHAAFELPGIWTLNSQQCSRDLAEWQSTLEVTEKETLAIPPKGLLLS